MSEVAQVLKIQKYLRPQKTEYFNIKSSDFAENKQIQLF